MKPLVDNLDRAIVDLLMTDGRMSCADIARSIGNVSPRTVRYRIQSLTERGLIKITPILNPKALGYGISADIFVQVEPRRMKEVAQALAALDTVNYVALSTGERDIAIQVCAADVDQLRTFITETLQNIPGVDHTRTYLLMEILKDLDSWRLPAELPANLGD